MISCSFGCDTPAGFRLMTKTCTISAWSRHSSRTPSPTMPVAPVMIALIFMNRGLRGVAQQAEIFPRHGGARKRGDLGDVVGRCHLDHIHAGEVQALQPAQDRLRLPARQAADLRGSGSGREGRIERVDIEAEI